MSLALGHTIIARSGVSTNLKRIVESFTLSNNTDRIILSNPCDSAQNVSLYIDKIHQDPNFYSLNSDHITLVFSETVESGCVITVDYWQTLPSGLVASDTECLDKTDLKALTPDQFFKFGIDITAPNFSQAIDVTRQSTTTYTSYTMPFNGFCSFFFNSSTNNFYLMDESERVTIGICGKDYHKHFFSPLIKSGTVLKFKTDFNETVTFQVIPTIK